MPDLAELVRHVTDPSAAEQLTAEGRRMARVALASADWSLEAWRASMAFFDRYYLQPDPEEDFDPGFYTQPLFPTPSLHQMMGDWWYQHHLQLVLAPRGLAKSTWKRRMMLRLGYGAPGFTINNYVAKDDFATEDAQLVRDQVEHNERLLEDFGEQAPLRGQGIWNNHSLWWANRTKIRFLSVEGRKRGHRCKWAILDDPEDDKDMNRSEERIRALSTAVRKVILPMMDSKRHLRLTLLGTLLGTSSFYYHIYHTREDKRFASIENGGHWFKVRVPAIDSRGVKAWPEKHTDEYLRMMEDLLGPEDFAAEFLNDPRPEGSRAFNLGDKCTYVVDTDLDRTVDPFTCRGRIEWTDATPKGESVSKSADWSDWLNKLTRFMAVDYALGQSPESDYQCVAVGGVDASNCLWVLDGWIGRLAYDPLVSLILRMGQLWRVGRIGVEAVGLQQVIADMLVHAQDLQDELNQSPDEWRPAVQPLRWAAGMTKVDRILALQSRFRRGKIKYAHDLITGCETGTFWDALRTQTTKYTLSGRGLRWDDAIDTVSMLHTMSRAGSNRDEAAPARTPLDLFLAGERYIEGTSIPLVSRVDPSLYGYLCEEASRQRIEEVLREQMPSSWDPPQGIRGQYRTRPPRLGGRGPFAPC